MQIEKVNFTSAQGEVTALGELSLGMYFTETNGALSRWDERRLFELVFACAQATADLKVCGDLRIDEILYQDAQEKIGSGVTLIRQRWKVAVVFAVDLVLLENNTIKPC